MPLKDRAARAAYAKAQAQANKEKIAAYKRAYAEANRESIRAKRQAKYQATKELNREKNKARCLAWYHANKDKCKEKGKIYYREHAEEERIYRAAYRQANRETILAKKRATYRANPDVAKDYVGQRRARKLNAPLNDFTSAQWKMLQIAQNHRCAYCGKRCRGRLTQDHILALSKGGSHTLHNIIGACKLCNAKKGNRSIPCPIQPLLL